MTQRRTDREIVAALAAKIGREPPMIEYDQRGRAITLDLSSCGLMSLPDEVMQLTRLKELYLYANKLTVVPEDLGQLSRLLVLYLSENQLTTVPETLGRLSHLLVLELNGNWLTVIPETLGQLSHLQYLYLQVNWLTAIPETLGRLSHLLVLDLSGNRLTAIPETLGQLSQLGWFDLNGNRLTAIPETLGQLSQLRDLYLNGNRLTTIPETLGQLSQLSWLDLNENRLTAIPETLGQLSQLQSLYLRRNRLTALPKTLGQLSPLQVLALDGNDSLMTPPPEIVAQGIEAMLAFLRELQRDSTVRYESKLLVVGEGGTGKSSLLRALRGDGFVQGLSTTHGIEVGSYGLPHPVDAEVTLTLNTWDFGGQEIYHATHQFFLTQRSLYLVVWNARLGVEQGRLDYWLKTIQVLAPHALILLVATHTDERAADINIQLYQATYPQIAGSFAVSNRSGAGLGALKAALAEQAAGLPLMGQPWPSSWLAVEWALLDRSEYHIDEAALYQVCASCSAQAQQTLADYLHELGKILYFRDDEVLRNLIVLKPNWITKAISRVLTDEATRATHGVLSHADLPQIWADYPPRLYPVFLRLMERFDLSYQIEADQPGNHPTRSLAPQLLPFQPPIALPLWPETPPDGQNQVQMIYRLDFVPAGIMSWFIVRTHRYTKSQHWREGVLLGYEGHDARVELNPLTRELRMVVAGVQPQNFLSILMHTADLILGRFEGLKVERVVPCICHWQRNDPQPCPYAHPYDYLARLMEKRRETAECREHLEEVPVLTLLYGIHPSTNQQVMRDLQAGQQQIIKQLDKLELLDVLLARQQQLSELLARDFTRRWNLEMQRLDVECPNTFCLMPGSRRGWDPRNWAAVEYRMYLICQHPPGPHIHGEGYPLRYPKEWWGQISPWLRHLVRFLKFGVPLGAAIEGVYDEATAQQFEAEIVLMEQMAASLPDLGDGEHPRSLADTQGRTQEAEGAALRALHGLLRTLDPAEHWADLRRTPTPDGNILWLCAEHRAVYEVKPLVLPD